MSPPFLAHVEAAVVVPYFLARASAPVVQLQAVRPPSLAHVEEVAGPFPSQSPYPRVVAVVEHHYLPSQDVGAAVAHLQ